MRDQAETRAAQTARFGIVTQNLETNSDLTPSYHRSSA